MKKILSVILSLILTFTFLNTSILAKEENIPDPKIVLNEGIQVESESSIKEFAKAVDKEAITFVIEEEYNSGLYSLNNENETIISQTEITYFIPKVQTRSTQNIDEAILAGSFYLYGTIKYLKSGNMAKLLSGNGGYRRGDLAFSVVDQKVNYGMDSGAYHYSKSIDVGKRETFSFTCPSSWPYVNLNATPRSIGYVHIMVATHGTVTYTSQVHNELPE